MPETPHPPNQAIESGLISYGSAGSIDMTKMQNLYEHGKPVVFLSGNGTTISESMNNHRRSMAVIDHVRQMESLKGSRTHLNGYGHVVESPYDATQTPLPEYTQIGNYGQSQPPPYNSLLTPLPQYAGLQGYGIESGYGPSLGGTLGQSEFLTIAAQMAITQLQQQFEKDPKYRGQLPIIQDGLRRATAALSRGDYSGSVAIVADTTAKVQAQQRAEIDAERARRAAEAEEARRRQAELDRLRRDAESANLSVGVMRGAEKTYYMPVVLGAVGVAALIAVIVLKKKKK